MKIVHFSTGHLGGAGLAARRLNEGLSSVGIDSIFFALTNPTYIPTQNELQINRNVLQSLKSKFSTLASKEFSDKVLVTPLSSNLIDENFMGNLEQSEKTIFHIHNWFNIFSQSQIARLSRRFNLVLTLHDQRLFTGACHYSLDCTKYKSVCSNCPQLTGPLQRWASRQHSIDLDFSELSYITPSTWLHHLATTSRYLFNSRGVVIPNCFFGYNTVVEKRVSFSPMVNVGLAAMDATSWIKGGELVSTLMSSDAANSSLRFHRLADFNDPKDFWSLVDVLLVPSKADNSPNVIHEAKLWGKPVVSSDVGGIPEILSEGFDSCIPLTEMTPARIQHEIQRVFFQSRDFDQRLEVSQKHKEFLDTSIPLHIDFYNSLVPK
jgi:glycosyltransferase involved in cell wall biosynthesis